MIPVIDAHHHLWNYSAAQYGWIDPSMSALKRDFTMDDLKQASAARGIMGTVAVQARQSIEETELLLAAAKADSFIQGIVGWLPLSEPDVEEHMARFSADPRLRGVRHVVQDEADPTFLDRKDFNAGVRLLQKYGLRYDLLIHEHQLPAAVAFVDRHPAICFILDHMAKPSIREGKLEPWASELRALAKRSNIFCKLSGLITEADHGEWTTAALRPYFDTVLQAFTPSRLMFGSDWPVCLLAASYERWMQTVADLLSGLSTDEQKQIWGKTAIEAYGLDIDYPAGDSL